MVSLQKPDLLGVRVEVGTSPEELAAMSDLACVRDGVLLDCELVKHPGALRLLSGVSVISFTQALPAARAIDVDDRS